MGDDLNTRPIWVGNVSQRELDAACPRNVEVQAIADRAAAEVKASGNYLSPQDLGNKVHKLIAAEIDSMRNPNFIAETTYEPIPNQFGYSGAPNSIRLDVLERSVPQTVCVYDHKTGVQGLKSSRVAQILTIVHRNFPAARRIVIIEIRPRQ